MYSLYLSIYLSFIIKKCIKLFHPLDLSSRTFIPLSRFIRSHRSTRPTLQRLSPRWVNQYPMCVGVRVDVSECGVVGVGVGLGMDVWKKDRNFNLWSDQRLNSPGWILLESVSHLAICFKNHTWLRMGSMVGIRTKYTPWSSRVSSPLVEWNWMLSSKNIWWQTGSSCDLTADGGIRDYSTTCNRRYTHHRWCDCPEIQEISGIRLQVRHQCHTQTCVSPIQTIDPVVKGWKLCGKMLS